METIAHYYIPTVYDIIRRYVEYTYGKEKSAIYHHGCGESFVGNFTPQYNVGGYMGSGKFFYCPFCGEALSIYDDNVSTYFAVKDQLVPTDMDVSVKEGADFIDLMFVSNTVAVDTTNVFTARSIVRQKIRFDFKSRKTIYMRSNSTRKWEAISEILPAGKTFRLITEDENNALIDGSGFLGAFLNVSSRVSKHRDGLRNVLTALRNAFKRKLEKTVGYKVRDVFAPPTACNEKGYFEQPIRAMIWKLLAPDAPKLTQLTRYRLSTMNDNLLPAGVFEQTKKGTSFVDAVMSEFNLTGRVWRRALTKDPSMAYFAKRIGFTDKPSLIMRLIDKISDVFVLGRSITPLVDLEECTMLTKAMAKRYGDNRMVEFIERRFDGDQALADVFLIFRGLSSVNKRNAIRNLPQRMRDIHDALLVWQQRDRGGDLPIQVHKRFVGTMGAYRFISPDNTNQLIDAGKRMHICVGSYGRSCSDGDKAVVLVANNNGEPVACLEIAKQGGRWKKVVQAKLAYNKVVASDDVMNAVVMDWIRSRKLIPATRDIDIEATVI
ncbi:PcfJ domain-containing protein [Veillonella magna]|uniref:PcfJ domain-containing protein n=1 Tax=Veillonella magna TaxID=464322 RepID=UPI0026654CF7|nr:PcfJ domain-containing protein [Veillonella magna]